MHFGEVDIMRGRRLGVFSKIRMKQFKILEKFQIRLCINHSQFLTWLNIVTIKLFISFLMFKVQLLYNYGAQQLWLLNIFCKFLHNFLKDFHEIYEYLLYDVFKKFVFPRSLALVSYFRGSLFKILLSLFKKFFFEMFKVLNYWKL